MNKTEIKNRLKLKFDGFIFDDIFYPSFYLFFNKRAQNNNDSSFIFLKKVDNEFPEGMVNIFNDLNNNYFENNIFTIPKGHDLFETVKKISKQNDKISQEKIIKL